MRRSASLNFKVQIVSDHNPRVATSRKVDLKGLHALMKDLESTMLEEIELYLDNNPRDDFNHRTDFYQVIYDSSKDTIYLYNGTHTEKLKLFSYSIEIVEAHKFAFVLMGGHPLFRGMEHEVF